jgi:hypothetical protein
VRRRIIGVARRTPGELTVKRLLPLVLVLLGATPALADRLTTKLGTVLEGEIIDTGGDTVDVKISEKKIMRVKRSDIARIESILSAEQLAQVKEGDRLFLEASAASGRPDVRARALAAFAKLDPALVEPLLLKKIGAVSGALEQRKLAASLLATHPDEASIRGLARSVVLDGAGAVRSVSMASLRKIGNPETGLLFVQALTRSDPMERTRAIAALGTFPRREAVAAMMKLGAPGVSSADSNASRCYVAVLTQRAYISGYTLSSGGTGLAVAEVAQPEINVLSEGVVLEVAARYIVEYETFVRGSVFGFLTGKSFKSDDQVLAWWKDAEKGFELAPAAEKQLASLAAGR